MTENNHRLNGYAIINYHIDRNGEYDKFELASANDIFRKETEISQKEQSYSKVVIPKIKNFFGDDIFRKLTEARIETESFEYSFISGFNNKRFLAFFEKIGKQKLIIQTACMYENEEIISSEPVKKINESIIENEYDEQLIAENIAFEDLFDIDEIQFIQDEFALATGIASVITSPDGSYLTSPTNFKDFCKIVKNTEKGCLLCQLSDNEISKPDTGKPTIIQCSCSQLWTAGVSIVVCGKHIANWIVGQVKDKSMTEDEIEHLAREIGIDKNTLIDAYNRIPEMKSSQFEHIAGVLYTLVKKLSELAFKNTILKKSNSELQHRNIEIFESKNFIDSLLKALPIAVFYKDKEGRYISCNKVFTDIIGLTSEQIRNKTVQELWPSEFADKYELKDKELIEKKQQQVYQYKVKDAQGEIRPVVYYKNVFYSVEGDVAGIVGAFLDISEQKKIETELTDKNNFIDSLLKAIPVPVFYMNEKAEYIGCNDLFSELFEVTKEDIFGKTVNQIWKGERYDAQYERDVNLLHSPKYTSYEDYVIDSKGNRREIIFAKDVFYNSDGNICGIVCAITDITDIKNTENALRQSEEKFRQITENISDIVFVSDINLKTTYVSPSVERILGETVQHHLSKSLKEKFTPDSIRRMGDMFVEELEYERTHKFDLNRSRKIELEYYKEGGGTVWLSANVRPLRNENGQVVGLQGVMRDITARKYAEEELQKSIEKNKALLEAIPDLMFVFDNEYRIIDFNHGSDKTELFRSYNDFFGKNIFEVLPQKLAVLAQEKIDKVLISKEIEVFTYEYVFKKKLQYFEARFVLCRENEVLAIIRNITEKKDVEIELKQQLDLRGILMEISTMYINLPIESLDSAISESIEVMGRFLNADRSYIFTYDFEKQTCNNIYEWCAEGISAEIENLQNVPFSDISSCVEAHLKKDLFLVDNVSLMQDETFKNILLLENIKSLITIPMYVNSECIGFIGFDSVRHYKTYTENEKQLINVFAQILVNIFQRKQVEEELIKAKLKAEESDKLKSAFLANMSHEIRTPMNGILGFANLLKSRQLTVEKQQEYIDIIVQSGERMLNIINDLVNISKIESGQMEINVSQFDVVDVFDFLLLFFNPDAKRKNLILTLNRPVYSRNTLITTDKEKLTAILINLINNAIKFTENGFVEFGYSLNQETLHFFVKDSGIGIPYEKQRLIFERFAQADSSLSNNYEGAGLGLSIAKAYAEMLGGQIWVESKPGKGSEFHFTVLSVQHDSSIEEIEFTETNNASDIQKNIKVLIVEDDSISQIVMTHLIEPITSNYMLASSGEQAISLFEANPDFDLILMDIKMGGMDGYTATRYIRKINKDVIIFAQTAYAYLSDIESAIDAGCNEHITKPIESEKFYRLIKKYF